MIPNIAETSFWAVEESPREFCYRIVPSKLLVGPEQMVHVGFEAVYLSLGELGYRFRDAGHDSEKVIVSLHRPLSQADIEKLTNQFLIQKDSGSDLGFC